MGGEAMVIDGIEYRSASQVATELGVTRQTLWRWRGEGRIPPGRRYRNRMVLYTVQEQDAIRRYANRLEPLGAMAPGTGDKA